MTLKSAIADFLSEQFARGNSPATLYNYRLLLDYFLRFAGNINTSSIKLDLCRSYHLELCATHKNTITIQSYIRALRVFLNWLYLNDYIKLDICRRFRLPKARKPFVNVLSDYEISRIYSTFDNDSDLLHVRGRVVVSLMLDSGLRLNELVTARRDKLHLDERYLIITGKGNKERAVSFGEQTARYITDYLSRAPSAPTILLNVDGSPLTLDAVKKIFRNLKIDSNIPRLHPHLLRHTFATRYLENGGNVYDLKELLGHTSLRQTEGYLHIAKTRIKTDFHKFSPLDNTKKTVESSSGLNWCSCGESNSGHLD